MQLQTSRQKRGDWHVIYADNTFHLIFWFVQRSAASDHNVDHRNKYITADWDNNCDLCESFHLPQRVIWSLKASYNKLCIGSLAFLGFCFRRSPLVSSLFLFSAQIFISIWCIGGFGSAYGIIGQSYFELKTGRLSVFVLPPHETLNSSNISYNLIYTVIVAKNNF